jgi:hypothetical protein
VVTIRSGQQHARGYGWAILKDATAQDGQRGYALLKSNMSANQGPGDPIYLWVPEYDAPAELPAVDPPGSKRVAASQLDWIE